MVRQTARAHLAWADYLALGSGRSLERLAQVYLSRTGSVPTRQLSRLKVWSTVHGWQQRLKDIADKEAAEVAEQQVAYRREIMETGFARDHERLRALKDLAVIMENELRQDDKRWCKDVKQIGSGAGAQRVDVERFNAAEVEQFRGLLDDIAKEKGERKQQTGLTVDGGFELTHGVDDGAARYVADLIAAGILASAKAVG